MVENYSEDELFSLVSYTHKLYPHIIDEVVNGKLVEHQEAFKKSLDDMGFKGDDINSLLECRDALTNEEAYINALSVNYKISFNTQSALYKQNKAELIKSFTNATKGKLEAEAKELELTKDMYEAERIYRRVVVYSEWLHSKNNVLSQRISHLKNELSLNQFVNNK